MRRYVVTPQARADIKLFRPMADGVEIVRVLHGARDIEAIFRGEV